ncbi:MAG: hypothetical protein RQ824_00820 [bacterium]|nr:hypothetical protein [bacterium]
MPISYDECPYCGRQVIKGAMKCLGCGKVLKTAEEQQVSIQRYAESQHASSFGRVAKVVIFILLVAAIWYAYNNYQADISSLIKDLLKRF